MRRLVLSWILVAALAATTVYYLIPDMTAGKGTYAFASARCAGQTLIVDAGHGGEDGGAVSLTGVPESGINLAVALKLDGVLGLYGVVPVLLRRTDISLHDDSAVTLREKKVSDLHNRVATIEGTDGAVLISIHQNTFQNAAYHGAQVFYSNEAGSLPLAQLTQELLRQTLDPENKRVPAKIPDTVYLMNHISCPAILVECGFLSNPEEEELLCSENYQRKIAAALAASWLQYQLTGADTNEEA